MARKNASGRKKEAYVPAYTDGMRRRDEAAFGRAEAGGKADWKAFQRLMVNDACANSEVLEAGRIGGVKLERVQQALEQPGRDWRTLLDASEALMGCSPHYYRLNSLYSNMALFCWGLDLYDVKDGADPSAVRKQYSLLAGRLERMNLKHEFSKIMKFLPYQDVFCGLVMEGASDFFIQRLDPRMCRLRHVQDGLYNFDMDMDSVRPRNLDAYPECVRQAFKARRDGAAGRWYSPPADIQVCIKMNSQWPYPYPMMIGLARDVLDLDVYKKLKLQSARTDNYKAIMIKVPIDEGTVDKPLLTPETLGIFAEINRESMTDDIGLLYTLGSDGEPVSFKDSSNTRNNVSDAVDELYNSSGESRELFNGSSSGTAVTLSVENDSGFVYGVYRQLERWVDRFIKLRRYNKVLFKFHFYLLDVTVFNRDAVSKRYRDAVSLGATVIDKWLASLDMTPSRTLGSYMIHEDVFGFRDRFVPLASSYNSSESEGGRPTSESRGERLGDEGERTRDSDGNMDR